MRSLEIASLTLANLAEAPNRIRSNTVWDRAFKRQGNHWRHPLMNGSESIGGFVLIFNSVIGYALMRSNIL